MDDIIDRDEQNKALEREVRCLRQELSAIQHTPSYRQAELFKEQAHELVRSNEGLVGEVEGHKRVAQEREEALHGVHRHCASIMSLPSFFVGDHDPGILNALTGIRQLCGVEGGGEEDWTARSSSRSSMVAVIESEGEGTTTDDGKKDPGGDDVPAEQLVQMLATRVIGDISDGWEERTAALVERSRTQQAEEMSRLVGVSRSEHSAEIGKVLGELNKMQELVSHKMQELVSVAAAVKDARSNTGGESGGGGETTANASAGAAAAAAVEWDERAAALVERTRMQHTADVRLLLSELNDASPLRAAASFTQDTHASPASFGAHGDADGGASFTQEHDEILLEFERNESHRQRQSEGQAYAQLHAVTASVSFQAGQADQAEQQGSRVDAMADLLGERLQLAEREGIMSERRHVFVLEGVQAAREEALRRVALLENATRETNARLEAALEAKGALEAALAVKEVVLQAGEETCGLLQARVVEVFDQGEARCRDVTIDCAKQLATAEAAVVAAAEHGEGRCRAIEIDFTQRIGAVVEEKALLEGELQEAKEQAGELRCSLNDSLDNCAQAVEAQRELSEQLASVEESLDASHVEVDEAMGGMLDLQLQQGRVTAERDAARARIEVLGEEMTERQVDSMRQMIHMEEHSQAERRRGHEEMKHAEAFREATAKQLLRESRALEQREWQRMEDEAASRRLHQEREVVGQQLAAAIHELAVDPNATTPAAGGRGSPIAAKGWGLEAVMDIGGSSTTLPSPTMKDALAILTHASPSSGSPSTGSGFSPRSGTPPSTGRMASSSMYPHDIAQGHIQNIDEWQGKMVDALSQGIASFSPVSTTDTNATTTNTTTRIDRTEEERAVLGTVGSTGSTGSIPRSMMRSGVVDSPRSGDTEGPWEGQWETRPESRPESMVPLPAATGLSFRKVGAVQTRIDEESRSRPWGAHSEVEEVVEVGGMVNNGAISPVSYDHLVRQPERTRPSNVQVHRSGSIDISYRNSADARVGAGRGGEGPGGGGIGRLGVAGGDYYGTSDQSDRLRGGHIRDQNVRLSETLQGTLSENVQLGAEIVRQSVEHDRVTEELQQVKNEFQAFLGDDARQAADRQQLQQQQIEDKNHQLQQQRQQQRQQQQQQQQQRQQHRQREVSAMGVPSPSLRLSGQPSNVKVHRSGSIDISYAHRGEAIGGAGVDQRGGVRGGGDGGALNAASRTVLPHRSHRSPGGGGGAGAGGGGSGTPYSRTWDDPSIT